MTELAVLSPWLKLTDIFARLSHHPGAKIVMIDTCRDDLLAAHRSPPPAPPGDFGCRRTRSFRTQASLGARLTHGLNGKNGPYAYFVAELLKDAARPRDALALFAEVRTAVANLPKVRELHQWPFVDQTMQRHVYLGAASHLRQAQRGERQTSARDAATASRW